MSLNRLPESYESQRLEFENVYGAIKSESADLLNINEWTMEMIDGRPPRCRIKSDNASDQQLLEIFNNLIGYRNNVKLKFIRLFHQAEAHTKGFLLSSLQAVSAEMKDVNSVGPWQEEALIFDDLLHIVNKDKCRLLTTKYLLVFAVEPEIFSRTYKNEKINKNIADLKYPMAIVRDDEKLTDNIFAVEKDMLRKIFEQSLVHSRKKEKVSYKIAEKLPAERLFASYRYKILKDKMLAGKAIEREMLEIFRDNPDLWREALESDE